MTCLWYVLTKCSHASQGQANDWENPPCYTVITQLAFTWEMIGLRRVTKLCCMEGAWMPAASCKRSKTPGNIPRFVFWRRWATRVKLLPTWGGDSAATESGFSPPIILGGFCMLGSEVLLGIESTSVCMWVWANAHPRPNWSNRTLTQVKAAGELWSTAGDKPELALSIRA